MARMKLSAELARLQGANPYEVEIIARLETIENLLRKIRKGPEHKPTGLELARRCPRK